MQTDRSKKLNNLRLREHTKCQRANSEKEGYALSNDHWQKIRIFNEFYDIMRTAFRNYS